jgi:hypothetical protein
MKPAFKVSDNELKALIEEALRYIPGAFGTVMHHRYWKPRCRKYGTHVCVDKRVSFMGAENIEVGDHVSSMAGSYVCT